MVANGILASTASLVLRRLLARGDVARAPGLAGLRVVVRAPGRAGVAAPVAPPAATSVASANAPTRAPSLLGSISPKWQSSLWLNDKNPPAAVCSGHDSLRWQRPQSTNREKPSGFRVQTGARPPGAFPVSEEDDPMREPANARSYRELEASGCRPTGRLARFGRMAALVVLAAASAAGLAVAPGPARAAAGGTANGVTVLSSDATGVTLQFVLPPYQVTSVVRPEGTFAHLVAPGLGSTVADEGRPLLPAAAMLLGIP